MLLCLADERGILKGASLRLSAFETKIKTPVPEEAIISPTLACTFHPQLMPWSECWLACIFAAVRVHEGESQEILLPVVIFFYYYYLWEACVLTWKMYSQSRYCQKHLTLQFFYIISSHFPLTSNSNMTAWAFSVRAVFFRDAPLWSEHNILELEFGGLFESCWWQNKKCWFVLKLSSQIFNIFKFFTLGAASHN